MRHDSAVRRQIAGKQYIQLVVLLTEPVGQLAPDIETPRKDERYLFEILRRDIIFLCQRRPGMHDDYPPFSPVQPDEFIFLHIDRLQQQTDIRQSPVYPVLYVVGSSRVDVECNCR